MVQARRLIAVYLIAEGLAATLWLAGAVLPAPVRYVCWAVAVAAEAAAPILATMRSAGLPLHLEHLPERFGLLVILVLRPVQGSSPRSAQSKQAALVPDYWRPTLAVAKVPP